MLDIQREKFETRDRLKQAGLSDLEIRKQLTEELKPFKPAFLNGKRIKQELPPLEPTLLKRSKRSQVGY
jgi:hypothetical protein